MEQTDSSRLLPNADTVPAVFGSLVEYIKSSLESSRACIGKLEGLEVLEGVRATAHFHFALFDGDGAPKFRQLARELVLHATRYCLSAQTRDTVLRKRGADVDGAGAEMQLIARDYFRKIGKAGEAGELLLFFLLETVFKAPQLVAKMELKTSPGDEVKRSDGLHFGWDDRAKQAILYMGESKLYKSIAEAVKDAIESVGNLYKSGAREDEIRLLTTHFKYADGPLKDAVLAWIDGQLTADRYRIRHVCLIGYDWDHFASVGKGDRSKFVAEFQTSFSADRERLAMLAKDGLSRSELGHLEFEFVFLPFDSVESFREAFLRELTGIADDQLDLRAELAKLRAENAKLKRSRTRK